MRYFILIATIVATGCVQVQASDPEICVSQSFLFGGTSETISELAGNQTIQQSFPIDLSSIPSGLITDLTFTPDSHLNFAQNMWIDSLTMDVGQTQILTYTEGDPIVFSTTNLAPLLDGGVLDLDVTLTGTLPDGNVLFDGSLCFAVEVQKTLGL